MRSQQTTERYGVPPPVSGSVMCLLGDGASWMTNDWGGTAK